MIQSNRQMEDGPRLIVAQLCAAWAVVLRQVAQRHTAHVPLVSNAITMAPRLTVGLFFCVYSESLESLVSGFTVDVTQTTHEQGTTSTERARLCVGVGWLGFFDLSHLNRILLL